MQYTKNESSRIPQTQRGNQEREPLEALQQFIQESKARVEQREIQGQKVLLLQLPGVKTTLSSHNWDKYVGELERILHHDNLGTYCKFFSVGAIKKRITSGMLLGKEITRFVYYPEHALGLDEQPQGIVAVEWTARHIDRYRGKLDLLLLQAGNHEQLLQACSQLYGGKWEVASPEEINRLYTVAYYDTPEQLFAMLEKGGHDTQEIRKTFEGATTRTLSSDSNEPREK